MVAEQGQLTWHVCVEDMHDNDSCDHNLNDFLHTVDVSSSLPPSSVSFIIVKISAICPMALLERVSDPLERSFIGIWVLTSIQWPCKMSN